jgi:hypothetical protein
MEKYRVVSELWQARTAWPFLLTRFGLTKLVAEVGGWKGDFADYTLNRCPGLKSLCLVDAWAKLPDYDDPMNEADFADIYRGIMQRFVYNTRAHIMRGESVKTAEALAGWAFDAVYIDANHSKEAALADIAAWWPLVRPGGVLAGHDYLSGEKNGVKFGVKDAVEEFFIGTEEGAKIEGAIYVTSEEYPSWLVIKQEGQGK